MYWYEVVELLRDRAAYLCMCEVVELWSGRVVEMLNCGFVELCMC